MTPELVFSLELKQTMENKPLSAMTVEDVFEFVSTKLCLPDLAQKFKEQDLDGEGLMELNTSLIQTYIPSITLGTCLKFFRLLKPYMKVSNLSTPDPFSSPTIPASTPTTPSSCAQTPICPTLLFASPSVSSSSQQSDEEETEVEIQQLDIQHEEASDILEDLGSPISPPRSSLTSKSSNSAVDSDIVSPRNSRLTVTPAGSFSIKKVQFPPAAMKMVETGKLSIAGKSAVTGAVVTMMLKQSTSSCYVDTNMKNKAATALVMAYPTLQFGMEMDEAIKSWHRSFTTKLINWRKRDKISGPELEVKRRKYAKQAAAGKAVVQSPIESKRRAAAYVCAEENDEDAEKNKKMLELELSKDSKSNNKKMIRNKAKLCFPARRKYLTASVRHTATILKEWPCLKVDYVLFDELCNIEPSAYDFMSFELTFIDLIPKIISFAQIKQRSYRHPLSNILFLLENDEKNQELQALAGMIGLCYLLPTTFKKLRLDAHQYLVDIVSNPAEDLHSAERRQPFILVIGTSFADFNKVIVYADGVPVCAFESVTKALYGVLSLYYAFNIEYSAAVFSALQFLQIKCLNIKEKARLSVTDLMNSLDQL